MTGAIASFEITASHIKASLMNRPFANNVAPHYRSYFLTTLLMVMSGCATHSPFSQDGLPQTIMVPPGNTVSMEVVAAGQITYQCRADNNLFEWVSVGPQATLKSRDGKPAGRYVGPPATWEAADGSMVTGLQVAIAAATTGNIPIQLVKANPATGKGSMQGVTYIQRVATHGGIAPATGCDMTSVGKKFDAPYRADYIFYKAN